MFQIHGRFHAGYEQNKKNQINESEKLTFKMSNVAGRKRPSFLLQIVYV